MRKALPISTRARPSRSSLASAWAAVTTSMPARSGAISASTSRASPRWWCRTWRAPAASARPTMSIPARRRTVPSSQPSIKTRQCIRFSAAPARASRRPGCNGSVAWPTRMVSSTRGTQAASRCSTMPKRARFRSALLARRQIHSSFQPSSTNCSEQNSNRSPAMPAPRRSISRWSAARSWAAAATAGRACRPPTRAGSPSVRSTCSSRSASKKSRNFPTCRCSWTS